MEPENKVTPSARNNEIVFHFSNTVFIKIISVMLLCMAIAVFFIFRPAYATILLIEICIVILAFLILPLKCRLTITSEFIEAGGFWVKKYNRANLLSINVVAARGTMIANFSFTDEKTLRIESYIIGHKNFLKILGMFPDHFPRTDKLHGGILRKKELAYIMEFSKNVSRKQQST